MKRSNNKGNFITSLEYVFILQSTALVLVLILEKLSAALEIAKDHASASALFLNSSGHSLSSMYSLTPS